jgi:hypothetical protein
MGVRPPRRGAAKTLIFSSMRFLMCRKFVIPNDLKVKFVFLKGLAVFSCLKQKKPQRAAEAFLSVYIQYIG